MLHKVEKLLREINLINTRAHNLNKFKRIIFRKLDRIRAGCQHKNEKFESRKYGSFKVCSDCGEVLKEIL